MELPPGALQQAFLVAVPLSLVVLVIITPNLIGREDPTVEDIPFLTVRVLEERWNATVNETILLYVRSALGVPLYEYLALNVSGSDGYEGENWTANQTHVPSLLLKFPLDFNRTQVPTVNVSAVAIQDDVVYRYNATIEFLEQEPERILRVTQEDSTSSLDVATEFRTSMPREESP